MINETENIKTLLNRFFEGETSNADEQTLYRYFAGDNLPDELAGYKPVFQYFETGLAAEAEAMPSDDKPLARRIVMRRWYVWSGLAAAVLAGVIYLVSYSRTDTFDPYEGSYIVRGGVKITDTRRIRPEIERTYRAAMEQQEAMERLINEATYIDDPADSYRQIVERHNEAFLSNFDDPYARETAKNIIETDFNNF